MKQGGSIVRISIKLAAAVVAVGSFVVMFVLVKDVLALGSTAPCSRVYGVPATHEVFSGVPGRTSWDEGGYHYEVKGFGIVSNGDEDPNALIDSRGSGSGSCDGGLGGTDDIIRTDLLKAGGQKPIAAYLGVPVTAGTNNGKWAYNRQGTSGTGTPTPPTFSQNLQGPAALVDDGGGVKLENSAGQTALLWCAWIQTDYLPGESCGPDAVSPEAPEAVAGWMFINESNVDGLNFQNCDSGVCGPEFQTWYKGTGKLYNPTIKNNYTSIIGVNPDKSLKDFQLHFQARQDGEGGFGTWMVMTFKYPISNAQCIGMTISPSPPPVGSTFSAAVTMKNTGTSTWNNTGNNPFRLGSQVLQDNIDWSPINGRTSNRVNLPSSVAPGDQVTVNFTATHQVGSPSNTFAWAIVQEGVQWYAGTGRECATTIGEPFLHKIFMVNRIDIPLSFVRDNFQFAINLMAYFWPDAGRRSQASDRTNRLWLAGIWGKDGLGGGDTAASDNAVSNVDPNAMSIINSAAEANCPAGGTCRTRIPMAYVPEDDRSGTPNTGTKDGSRTPNGNLWMSIRDRVSTVTGGYNSREGGIASDDASNVGGAGGNRINNVEVSNIRVEAVGIANSATDNTGGPAGGYGRAFQGRVASSVLQNDSTTQGLNLPGGSQGPQSNIWDNIRNPQGGSGVYSANVFGSALDNTNSGGSPANFTDDPASSAVSAINTFVGRARQVGTVTATSLLQDGQGTYTNKTEPITYSASVTRVSNARLKWDEYIDWTQVDDKGHWYTDKANRATGVYQGNGTSSSYSLERFDSGSSQFSHIDHSVRYSCPTRTNPGRTCHRHSDDIYVYTQCTGSYSYRTGIAYNYSNLTYYYPTAQTQYGWYNTSTTTQSMPYGSNGGTRQSAFYNSYSSSPNWSNTGNTAYWQDTNVTAMSNSGSTNKPAHLNRWIRNTTDPAYNNRYIYSNTSTPSFPTGWYYTYSSSCKYPNGNGASVSSNGTTSTYYPSPGYLYENSGSGTGPIHGAWGNGATFDGSSDGQVDVGWSWASNKQRVRYEHTYNGHYRNLGPRDIYGSGDNQLYGPGSTAVGGKPARGTTTIGNPTIGASEGDIFSAGGISSYFETSTSSAFLFTNDSISNFDAARSYLGYYINRDKDRVNATFPGGDSVRYVFKNFDSELLGRAVSYPGGSNVNLDGRIYRTNGNYTINATTFCNGAGTIIVEGNLTVNGNLDYCNGTTRASLPSVGFIVTGSVSVSPGVDFMKGAYFVNGSFSTGSVTLTGGSPNNNRTSSDRAFSLQGLIVANRFSLDRQLSGEQNVVGVSELFTYDGRIVISSPPGFSSLYNIPAVWNEGAPSN